MVEGRERRDFNRNKNEEKELPDWAKEIQTSYKIFDQVEKRTDKDLGNSAMNQEGRLVKELNEKSRSLFYEFRQQTLDDLPVGILLEKKKAFSVKLGPIIQSQTAESKYYLPSQDCIYRLPLGFEKKYTPDSPDFVGYDAIVSRPQQHHYGIFINKMESPYGKLKFSEIEKIINYISKIKIKPETKYLCEMVKDELKVFFAEEAQERKKLEHEYAEGMRKRVGNIIRSISNAGRKLPDKIKGFEYSGGLESFDHGHKDEDAFLLPKENKMVSVPAAYHGRKLIRKYDFDAAVEADDVQVIQNAPRFVSDLLLKTLGQDIYYKLMGWNTDKKK